MYGIYYTKAWGRDTARELSAISRILSACDITFLHPMSIYNYHRYAQNTRKRRDKLILFEMDLQSHSLSQPSNVNQTSDCIVTEGCGQIDTID